MKKIFATLSALLSLLVSGFSHAEQLEYFPLKNVRLLENE